MTIFKGFLTIMKRNLHIVILYAAIFVTICLMVQKMMGTTDSTQFKMDSLDIAVIDRDGGTLAKNLTKYLGQYHNLVDVPDDKTAMQERLFYRDVYYLVIIPENFEENCLTGSEKLTVTKVPGSATGYYVDQQINSFLNDVRIMTVSGFTIDEAVKAVYKNSKAEASVKLLDKNGHGGALAPYSFTYQYMPYIIISILCYVLGFIMISYRKPDLKRRMLCSAISARRQNGQLILGFLLVGITIWLLCTLLPIVLNGKAFLSDPNLPYYLINSFMLMLVALSISFLLSVLIHREELLNAVVNVITLGMSFVCGVFVSLEVLGTGIQNFARLLPVYWYEVTNTLIANNAVFNSEQLRELYIGYGIQLLFAVAILCIALAISRIRTQE